MAHLVRPDPSTMAQAGLSSFAHVPFLLSRDMDYLDDFNRYLRERALGHWHPNRRGATAYGRVTKLSENSIFAYASDLTNFASYLETKRLDWTTLTHQGLLDTYDKDMIKGKWRSKGKAALSPSTVNRRIRTAVEVMLWGEDQRLRPPFQVLVSASSRRRRGRRGAWHSSTNLVDSRVGIHRANPKRLRLPTTEELERWLQEVRSRYGRARYLAVKFILQTGARLEETALVRAAQLPHPDFIGIDMPARMDICFGTKGERDPADPERVGKERTLRFNRSFLVELNNYRELGRKKALRAFEDRRPKDPKPQRLFLDEKTGAPLSKMAIYRAWHNCKTLPFRGYSPHLGRHTFACYELLRLIDEEMRLIGLTAAALPRTQLPAQVERLVSMYLSPVLGHVDEETTDLYLEWLADHLWVAEHRAAWTNYLEESE